ncbi:MAG TPA: sodium:solute symporter family protein [Methanothrix sp.]|nr:sodium:solute symporter family protein [Methanothrix sp.]
MSAIQPALVIAIYLLIMLAVSAWGPRRRGIDDFHLAGRRLQFILLTATFCATIVGASSTLGMAGLGFSKGLPGAWWMLSGTLGMLVLSLFLAERIRASGCYTLPELVGSFYGEHARLAASLLIAISWVGVIAVQILAAGRVLSAVFGGSGEGFMIACTAVFVLYTAHGGQSSVVRTDLVQLFIIITGMAILFARGCSSAGPALLLAQSFPTSAEMGGWDVISMVLVVGSAYLVGPDMYSRILSARSPGQARASAFLSAILLVPLAFLVTSLGVFSRSLYPSAQPEQAVLMLLGDLSPIIVGMVAAALLAAFMSSADTSLMTVTSILTLDIYRKARPLAGPERLLAVSRAAVLVTGLFALILAILMPGIIKTLLSAYTVFTGGLLVPVVAGFYRERLALTSGGALSAMLGGGGVALLFGQRYPLLAMCVSMVLLLSVSFLQKRILAARLKRESDGVFTTEH